MTKTNDTDKAKKTEEHLLSGRTTKYDENIHIPLLYNLFAAGESIYAFCAEALISRRTFYNWRKKNEKFNEAYEILINIAARYWEKLPMTEEGRDINFHYWHMIMKNRFDYGKPRFVVNDGQGHTPLQVIHAIFAALENGELTIQEASQLASLAVTQANIENGTTEDTSNTVKHRTTEELEHRLSVVNSLIKKGSETVAA